MKLDKERVLPIVKAALKEDIGKGDITTSVLIDRFQDVKASIITNEDCVVCGLHVAELAMASVDYSVRFKPNCDDGASVGRKKEIAYLEGRGAAILRTERTMINFLTFLSGIATRTKEFVEKARPHGVKIMDTRKTIPLMRYLEKYAISCGGGANHRMGLYDQVLIKDNHIQVSSKKNSLAELIERARKNNSKGTIIEIEVTSPEEFNQVLAAKPDIVMLDNMSPADIRIAVEMRRFSKVKPLIEVSGGVTLENVEEYAKTGVEMISVGELTDSVHAIDMSLEIV